MDLLILIGAFVIGIFSWIVWALIAAAIALGAVLIPWAIWEFFMFLTFNNVINLFAKAPGFIGWILGFFLTLPSAAIATAVSIWAYIQAFLMGLLTFRGFANGFSNKFIEDCVMPLENGWTGSLFIVRYYYEHCQWIWGGAGFQYSYYPWQNGCGPGWSHGSFWCPPCETPVAFWIIKLFLLAIPYLALFVVPLFPVVWSFTRPIVGACSALPAVSGNGDGKD